jgi:ATP-dependent Clp protease, protease subunit
MISEILYPSHVRVLKWRQEPVVISLTEEVNSDMVEYVTEQINEAQQTGQSEVMVVINSPGGDVYSCLAIISVFRQSKIPIVTVCEGLAASAAAVLFTCGKERYMAPHAVIMIHDVSNEQYGHATLGESLNDSHEMAKLNDDLYTIMAENTGNDSKFFKKKTKHKSQQDRYVRVKQALEWNLATHAGVPQWTYELVPQSRITVQPPAKKRRRVIADGYESPGVEEDGGSSDGEDEDEEDSEASCSDSDDGEEEESSSKKRKGKSKEKKKTKGKGKGKDKKQRG